MKNLQSFFKEEQDRKSQLHHLLDGKITLYIREKSAYWQARVKSMQDQVKRTQQAIKAEKARQKIKVGQQQLAKISIT